MSNIFAPMVGKKYPLGSAHCSLKSAPFWQSDLRDLGWRQKQGFCNLGQKILLEFDPVDN
jgi:hypothetical protein